jgi:transcriptional regulator with XRE-family HTH domain
MPPTLAGDFGRSLKELREERGATQADVAQAVGVSRPMIAQWEAGRHLPSPDRSTALDDYLRAQGALRQVVEHARRAARKVATATSEPADPGTSLLSVFRDVESALEDYLLRDADRRPLGWCHDLQRRNRPPTPVATAFGIKALLLIEEAIKADLGSLGEHLLGQAQPDGGWSASTQLASRPEAIAVVIDAIVRIDPTADLSRAMARLEATLDAVAWQRPFIMATVLETMLDLRPESELATRLMRGLLDSRRPFGGDAVEVWSQKAEEGLASPLPSVLHTARAVCVLARARSEGAVPEQLAGEVEDALGIAVEWLGARPNLENTTENIRRTVEGRDELVSVRHFTPALVTRALVLSGERVTNPTVAQALGHLWAFYDHEHSLWRWSNGDLPIWMTFDAIAALRLAALAAFHPH